MSPRAARRFGHAARVAAVTTLVVALAYAAVVAAIDVAVVMRLTRNSDASLAAALDNAGNLHGAPIGGYYHDADDAPVYVWSVSPAGAVTALVPGAPSLGAHDWSSTVATVSLSGGSYRVEARRHAGGWYVAATGLAESERVRGTLIASELLIGPLLLVAVYLGAMAIGVKAAAPVEEQRRRQLEFTADASHELRTPLSVIEAEVSLALRGDRDAASYRQSLKRVHAESARLRNIVDSLLFLARFDDEPPHPGDDTVDLDAAAEACADRFAAVAEAARVSLEVDIAVLPVTIRAPADWVDRLLGVLVDNAVRHAGRGGAVRISVGHAAGARALVAVEDSGPGIPPWERARMFDRFHRTGNAPGGAGLGLAIADAVVRSSDGRWRVGTSPLGGARMEVSWHRAGKHRQHVPGGERVASGFLSGSQEPFIGS